MEDRTISIVMRREPVAKKRALAKSHDMTVSHAEQHASIMRTPPEPLYMSQIAAKLQNYRQQDAKKARYDETRFIELNETVDMLRRCGLTCVFCRQPVFVLYEDVREARQWTLDRINNIYGHNSDNVDVACLDCNLTRRTKSKKTFVQMKCTRIVRDDKVTGECNELSGMEQWSKTSAYAETAAAAKSVADRFSA